MKKNRTKLLAIGIAAASILAFSACASSGSDSGSSADSSGGAGEPIKIGYFIPGTNNSYVGTNVTAAEETAQKLGVDLEVVSANWDAATQTNQFDTALARKTYNAWLVAAVAPEQACGSIKDAMAAGIKVFVTNQGLCGDDTYTEGTLGFVGGQTLALYDGWFSKIAEDNPDGGKIALLTGPNLNYNTNNALAAFKDDIESDSKFDVVSNQQSDYTTATAFDVAQATLQANPDLKIYAANYAEMTKGIVEAVEAAGLTGKVKVYDFGGNEWATGAVADGTVALSLPMLPYTEVQKSVEELVDAWNGKEIPQVLDLSKELTFTGAPYLTKDNVSEFTAEYQ
ncbi:sugar ABC transporter substrate-binding protein [Compostimonas suwonensis]|uniref:Ribose transport system substrate-binding protein n=1 Tax=Compostimonas suwonensis TaxID=1048394 RepID=A0A2M9BUT4_9MICO|nr:sugar ABC transporter substrate-binding protein [Compostimonas suwonensis]PJJ61705.1 ribose transport system substrate-binding protein [Compostimonas suwonensis]